MILTELFIKTKKKELKILEVNKIKKITFKMHKMKD